MDAELLLVDLDPAMLACPADYNPAVTTHCGIEENGRRFPQERLWLPSGHRFWAKASPTGRSMLGRSGFSRDLAGSKKTGVAG
jgi:hypothetical protein